MAIMTTKRCYWVDWICTFDAEPTKPELKKKQDNLIKYLRNYLKELSTKTKDGTGNNETVFNEKIVEWNAKEFKWGPPTKSIKPGTIIIGATTDWINSLRWEWDQLSFKPLVFNFKAYFEVKGVRLTNEQKGTMTPPPPPRPPGSS